MFARIRWFLFGACFCVSWFGVGCSPAPYTTYHRITPQVDPWFAQKTLATICILRAEQFHPPATVAYFDNKRFVGMTEHDGIYFCYLARPGLHHIVARSTRAYPVQITFQAQPNQCYYFRQFHRSSSFNLEETSDTTARKLLVHLLYAYVRATPDALPPYRMPVPAQYAPSSW